ncbi:hypothetical protein B0H14DRAFT_2967268 [Mycena olivaceomarginata]|nr:hypothetical protein B0H14DRAFT_2967268 [Mycena olivaceomarginata]
MDPLYLVLILCLVVSNISRIIRGSHWLYEYLSELRQPGPRLVPYFDRQGQLLGMVRIAPRNSFSMPPQLSSRRSPISLPVVRTRGSCGYVCCDTVIGSPQWEVGSTHAAVQRCPLVLRPRFLGEKTRSTGSGQQQACKADEKERFIIFYSPT